MPRIALYSHDTLGLGHLRRCLKIAQHLRHHFPSAEGYILTGSPWHRLFTPPPGFRFDPLPPVVKGRDGRYRSRDPGADFVGLLARRRERIEERLTAYRPHLFVVDNVPCGLMGEALPALRSVRALGGRSVLALRDVLDELGTVRVQWELSGGLEAVEELFDEVWVFGDDGDTTTLVEQGPLADVAAKVHRCGRIGFVDENEQGSVDLERSSGSRPVVLVTGGGGRDASPLMKTYLDAVETFRPPVTSHLVLGPDYPRDDRPVLTPRPRRRLDVASFVTDLPRRLAASNVIVSMAGYNTVCEILASGRPAVLVPRVTPRQEQLLRARRWARSGRTLLLAPDELSPDALWASVERLLGEPPSSRHAFPGGPAAAGRAAILLEGAAA